ncbi:MAG TPA: DUF4446 family protein [Candidatus Paceibacterota bacterium]
MSFSAFNTAALGFLSISAPYMAAGALLLALIAIIIAAMFHRRLVRLTLRRGESLEDTLGELTRRARELQAFREELEVYLKHAESRIQTSARGFGIVRFNPFEGDGSGGNQSFALALLDEHHNGVVLSAIYARSGATSVYGKPVKKGVSTFELTDEEREAIAQAQERMTPEKAERKK